MADRNESRGARFEGDKTDRQVLRATNRKLACDRYMPVPLSFGDDAKRLSAVQPICAATP